MPAEDPAMPPRLPALTDAQIDIIFRLAAPLLDVDRGPFLEDVARALGGLPEIGDGIITRVCREVQKKYRHPPELLGAAGSGKYR
jgi:hypothetical protein